MKYRIIIDKITDDNTVVKTSHMLVEEALVNDCNEVDILKECANELIDKFRVYHSELDKLKRENTELRIEVEMLKNRLSLNKSYHKKNRDYWRGKYLKNIQN